MLALVLVLGSGSMAFAAEEQGANIAPDVQTGAEIENAVKLDTNRQNEEYFVTGNELVKLTFQKPEMRTRMTRQVDEREGAVYDQVAEMDVIVRKADISEEEKTELLSGKAAAASTHLTRSDQDYSDAGHIRLTLKVTYTKPKFSDGNSGLHLCKVTSTWARVGGTAEGVAPKTSELTWYANGEKYVNGKFSGYTGSLGTTKKYTTPTVTNVQLMPENTAMLLAMGGAEVGFDMNCSRGVTLHCGMKW